MSARSTDTAKQSAYFRLIKLPTMKSSADLSSPRIAWDHFADPESGLSAKKKLQLRILVFVAHPDDEVIGASSLMSRVADVSVIFLTDGTPHDPCFWSPDAKGTGEYFSRTNSVPWRSGSGCYSGLAGAGPSLCRTAEGTAAGYRSHPSLRRRPSGS